MNDNQERYKALSDFLQTRRAKIMPEQVGLPTGSRRRTPGLRREEVAQLAGVGVTWYTWLEQGRDIKVSEQVLESLVRVLQLDTEERKHLFKLAHRQIPADPPPLQEVINPTLQRTIDSMELIPAFVIGRRWDILARNRATVAVFGDLGDSPRDRNIIWCMFTKKSQRELFGDWQDAAQSLLARFRLDAGRYPDDPYFLDLIKHLKEVSPEFNQWWPRHEVQGSAVMRKELNHPLVGLLAVEPITLRVDDMPNLKIIMYTPLPEAGTIEKLQRLMELSGEEETSPQPRQERLVS